MHEETSLDTSGHMDFSDLRECNVLWAVSVPGEAQWCSDELDGSQEGSLREYQWIMPRPLILGQLPHPSLSCAPDRTRTPVRTSLNLVCK